MKTYKCVIFTIFLLIGILYFIGTLTTYSGWTEILLVAIFICLMWFNWQYALGDYPQISFLQAVCVQWVVGAVGIYLSVNYVSNVYNVGFDFTINYFWEHSPNIIILPIVCAPITVLFWRWAFKEVREASKIASTNS